MRSRGRDQPEIDRLGGIADAAAATLAADRHCGEQRGAAGIAAAPAAAADDLSHQPAGIGAGGQDDVALVERRVTAVGRRWIIRAIEDGSVARIAALAANAADIKRKSRAATAAGIGHVPGISTAAADAHRNQRVGIVAGRNDLGIGRVRVVADDDAGRTAVAAGAAIAARTEKHAAARIAVSAVAPGGECQRAKGAVARRREHGIVLEHAQTGAAQPDEDISARTAGCTVAAIGDKSVHQAGETAFAALADGDDRTGRDRRVERNSGTRCRRAVKVLLRAGCRLGSPLARNDAASDHNVDVAANAGIAAIGAGGGRGIVGRIAAGAAVAALGDGDDTSAAIIAVDVASNRGIDGATITASTALAAGNLLATAARAFAAVAAATAGRGQVDGPAGRLEEVQQAGLVRVEVEGKGQRAAVATVAANAAIAVRLVLQAVPRPATLAGDQDGVAVRLISLEDLIDPGVGGGLRSENDVAANAAVAAERAVMVEVGDGVTAIAARAALGRDVDKALHGTRFDNLVGRRIDREAGAGAPGRPRLTHGWLVGLIGAGAGDDDRLGVARGYDLRQGRRRQQAEGAKTRGQSGGEPKVAADCFPMLHDNSPSRLRKGKAGVISAGRRKFRVAF